MKMKRAIRSRCAVALCVAGAIVTACVSQRHLSKSDVRPLPTSQGAFDTTHIDGLRAAINASPDGRPVRVLAVHGMLTNTEGYSGTMQENLAARLGLYVDPEDKKVKASEINRKYAVTVFGDGHPYPTSEPLKPTTFRRTNWRDSHGIVRVVYYEVLWAPMRDQIKERFLAAFEARTLPASEVAKDRFTGARPNVDSRDAVNAYFKDNIIVGGIADAAILLGPVGDVLRDDVHQVLVTIAIDEVAAAGLPLTPQAARVRRAGDRAPTNRRPASTRTSTRPAIEALDEYDELASPMMRASQRRADANVAAALADRSRPPAIGLMQSQERLSFARLTQAIPTKDANDALSGSKFFVITESLGSFLLLDMQQRFATLPLTLAGDKESAGDDDGRADRDGASAYHLLDNATVFMRANQVALLQLARLRVAATPDDGPDAASPNPLIPTYAATTQACEAEAKALHGTPKTIYVAFNDANDLLGFELPPYLPDTGRYGPLVNVSVKNPAIEIPFLLKFPDGAHRHSDKNPAVIEAVVEGFDIPPTKSP